MILRTGPIGREFGPEGVNLPAHEDKVRAAESDNRRAPDSFAEMRAITKPGVGDCDECAERSVKVRRGHGALEGDVNDGHGNGGMEGLLHHY